MLIIGLEYYNIVINGVAKRAMGACQSPPSQLDFFKVYESDSEQYGIGDMWL